MELKTILALKDAATIVDTAIGVGRSHDTLPLTVIVLDVGGHTVVMKREDGSGIMRCDIGTGKAWGALGMGVPTRLLGDRLVDRPAFQGALAAVSDGRFVAVPAAS